MHRSQSYPPLVFDIPPDATSQPFMVELLTPLSGNLAPRREHSVRAALTWSKQGLRVRVKLLASAWHESRGDEELWRHDSVELFFAPRPGAQDHLQWTVSPGMDPEFAEPRVKLYDFRKSAKLKKENAEISLTRTRIAGGCNLDFLLPWKALGIRPRTGRCIGFQVIVNRSSQVAKSACRLAWYPGDPPYSTKLMHRLRLAPKASAPVQARLEAVLDLPSRSLELTCLAVRESPVQIALVGGRVEGKRHFSGHLVFDRSLGLAKLCVKTPAPPLDRHDISFVLTIGGRIVDQVHRYKCRGQIDARALTLTTRASPAADGQGLRLSWPDEPRTQLEVYRRRAGASRWRKVACTRGDWTDPVVRSGCAWEYAVHTAQGCERSDYLMAGWNLPPVERRGTVLLLVEAAQVQRLGAKIERLQEDLQGDGWQVRRHDVSAKTTPMRLKEKIIREVRTDAEINSVFLLGHLPVPYAGNLAPDGHPDHQGAWSADTYYGDLQGCWTDSKISSRGEVPARTANVPGDGKFDQSQIPGKITLAVGRVDFHDLPAFRRDAGALLAQYLDRNHAWRQGRLQVPARGVVYNGFPGMSEGFAANGWQNLDTLLGKQAVRAGAWQKAQTQAMLWLYGCGGGSFTSMSGGGNTRDLARKPLLAVFTMAFGSYFGDWDSTDNYLRSILAARGHALMTVWAGRPNWFFHPMGLGATLGDCVRISQNNSRTDYAPAGINARGVHMALLGDPTLRMHVLAPPKALRLRSLASGGNRLAWSSPEGRGYRYLVYRRFKSVDPFSLLTPEPLTQREFHDLEGGRDSTYMVKSTRLQKSQSGSYWNTSQGVRVSGGPTSKR